MKMRRLLFIFLLADYALSQGQEQHRTTNNEEAATSNKRLSEEKCKEYSKPIVRELSFIALIADAKPTKSRVSHCGNEGIRLIIGGAAAASGEFPFMAAIGFGDSNDTIVWGCGGTLISEKFVVTAAHCISSQQFGAPTFVRLGEHDLKESNDGGADFGVLRIIVHPDHSFRLKYNDIALLELNGSVKFTEKIRPACVWSRNEIEQSTAIATGWGLIDPDNGTSASDVLLKVELNLISNPECQASYENYDPRYLGKGIVDSMLCAGDLKESRDTCKGDSGGPLFVKREGSRCAFHVVGITSFGRHCGIKRPAVYTRVSAFVDWIEETVWRPKS